MTILSGPKGTRDFYPEQMAFREHIFNSWHRTCKRFGFELFDAPLFESLELYTRKSGDEIEKQLYSFEDKGGRMVALRPEMTPSLARMVAAQGTSIKKPVRWYSIPRLFRYEKMQRGRLREFFQINMDILGVAEITADAELIAASVAMMQDLGLDHTDFSVRISSRKLLEEYLLLAGVDEKDLLSVYALLDRREKMPPEQFETDLAAILSDTALIEKAQAIFAAGSLDDLGGINAEAASYAEMRELFIMLEAYGLSEYVEFDIGIVRGLAYYTGIVFELHDRARKLRAIAGGGRYDHLVKSYGGPPTPATGFAAGDSVLGELLKDKGITVEPLPRCEAYVVGIADAWPLEAVRTVQSLRTAGIAAEYAPRGVAVGRQLKFANAARALVVVFVGGEEAAQGQVKVKNMATGEESTVAIEALVETVRTTIGS